MSWSGYARSPPRRPLVRGSEYSPFSTSPSLLQEVTLDPLSSSNDGSSGPTMDYEAQLSHFKKENFNLKLRIYFLEERLGPYRGGKEKEDPFKKNIELKVEIETLRKELHENQQLLRDAARAMDHLEKQHKEAIQQLVDDRRTEKLRFEQEIKSLKKDLAKRSEQPSHDSSAAMYAFAFGMPELVQQKSQVDKEKEEKMQLQLKDLEAQTEELKKQLDCEREDHNRLESELAHTRAEKEQVDHEIDDVRGKLGDRDHELEDMQKQIRNLEEALMAKEPEIRIKVQELAQRDKMIDEANMKLEAQEKVLVEIQITLDEKQKQIEALRASLSSKDDAIDGLRSKLAESESAARELQEKLKRQRLDGMSLTPEQRAQLEKNVQKRRIMNRNHARGPPEATNGGRSNVCRRPGTAPPSGKGFETDEEAVQKLQEEADKWKKKAEEIQKEIQQRDALAKNMAAEDAKVKSAMQGVVKRMKEMEREVEKLKQEHRRKDKKIRDLICQLTVANDEVNKAKWEGVGGGGIGRQQGMGVCFSSGLDDVEDMADEENERLWAELEDKDKKLKQLREEKNAISSEFEKKIQSLLASLKEKEESLNGFEEKYKALAAQLSDKNNQIKTLEAQVLSSASFTEIEHRRSSKVSSITEWISQQKILNTSTRRESVAVRLSTMSEDHSFLHSHIQKLQRNLRNTPERDCGPRSALEEVEAARHEAEEVRALLGGHLWELAGFLEGLLEETNISLSESRKTALRRALEWSRELSISVLSTTGLGEDSERNCTRTSLSILRDFPSFCACVEETCGPNEILKDLGEGSVQIEEIVDQPCQDSLVRTIEEPKEDVESSLTQGPQLSVESLHSTVEALRNRVRELEKEVGSKMVDLREGSSEMGRGGNSGESVRTVRDVRPTHLNLSQGNGNASVAGQKLEACGDAVPMSCTPAGAIASPSESEGWSEPDRTVSLARMGLEEMARTAAPAANSSAAPHSTAESGGFSLVETRTPSKRSHGEVRRLQNRLRGLEQVIEALRAELRVYHSMASVAHSPVANGLQETPHQNNVFLEVDQGDHEGPCTKDAEVNTTVVTQSEAMDAKGLGHLLEEVRFQRDKLECSLKQNELIGQQLESVLSGIKCHLVKTEDGVVSLSLCHKLKEATERLEEEQARCRDLQTQLAVAKTSLVTLEAKLQEATEVEMKLRAALKDKEEQLEDALSSRKILDMGAIENSLIVDEQMKVNLRRKNDNQHAPEDEKMPKMQESIPVNRSVTGEEKITVFTQNSNLRESFSFGRSSKSSEYTFFDNTKRQQKLSESSRAESGVEVSDPEVLETKRINKYSPNEKVFIEKSHSYSDVPNKSRQSLFREEAAADAIKKLESEASALRLALKKSQENAHAEELRARKAEENAHHWMEVAKEQEKIDRAQSSVSVRTIEDPSEGSSSSALSSMLPDLARQRSEMSDYVSDQTGGEDSEPSLTLSPNQNRSICGRPSIIPLEVSHAMTYLSPAADISPTARHDAFSSPDLGIESDPGRFSSLENPPKSPDVIRLNSLQLTDVLSSGKTLHYCSPFMGNKKSHETLSASTLGEGAEGALLDTKCLNDLRLENEHLKRCLVETRKNLDETMSKLEAANRRRLNVEKAICNQLQKTHHILRKARVNISTEVRD